MPARRAGTGLHPLGGRVTWTVADGTRGRRWRAMLLDEGALVGVLLLETGPDGGTSKLELATAAGLLTLHPEGGTLHGNVVRPSGVEHVALPWATGHLLLVAGSPASAAAASLALATRIGVGEEADVPGVGVDVELRVRPATFRVTRVSERSWRLVTPDGGEPATSVTLDEDGIPLLEDGRSWPVELG